MAEGYSHVTLIGNLTKDPVLSMTSSGRTKTSMSVAVNRSYKEGDRYKEAVDFFIVQTWGKTAENVAKYLRKGDQITCIGRVTTWRRDQDSFPEAQITAELVFGPREAYKRTLADAMEQGEDFGDGIDYTGINPADDDIDF